MAPEESPILPYASPSAVPRPRRISRAGIWIGLACLVVLPVTCILELVLPDRATMGRYRFVNGVEIKLFVENDWETGDHLYYRIIRNGKEVVQMTYLTAHDRKTPLVVHTATSADNSVVGLWVVGSEDDTFVMFHVSSGESWPRCRDDEASHAPPVKTKWNERYRLLRRADPALSIMRNFAEVDGEAAPSTSP